MKTFKLISLDILSDSKKDLTEENIPLIDGLIIDREDINNQWVLECVLDQSYRDYFSDLRTKQEKVMLQAKITKESNQPAIFLSSILEINMLNDKHVNVLFMGKLTDRKEWTNEETVKEGR